MPTPTIPIALGAPEGNDPVAIRPRGLCGGTRVPLLVLACVAMGGCAGAGSRGGVGAAVGPDSDSEVILASEVEWAALNPARGERSPRAGALWGDRTGPGPTGFLVEFVDGFSSPPHIHNVSYRGVVISGRIHNDDPDAATMWMPAGSYWTQPKGEAHITAARGDVNMAYIEIEDGPYLVLPPEQAFDSGERPINVDASNIVWLDASGTSRIVRSGTGAGEGPEIAFLWGSPRGDALNGALVRLPAGFDGAIRGRGPSLRAVVIGGRATHGAPGGASTSSLTPGSSFGSKGEAAHAVSCGAGGGCVIYVRAEGAFEVVAGPWSE